MKQIVLNIKESKLAFFMELIKSLDFVEVEEDEPTKEEILAGIEQGLKEAKKIQKGELEAQSLNDFLNEL